MATRAQLVRVNVHPNGIAKPYECAAMREGQLRGAISLSEVRYALSDAIDQAHAAGFGLVTHPSLAFVITFED